MLDNFIEVEHTPQVHALLGYPADRMHEVTCTTTTTPESVHVHNIGPQRTLPSPLYPIFDIPRDAWFVDEWTTYFSPVHTVYDQYFVDPVTRRRTSDLNRIGVFFTPLDDHRTDLHVLAYSSASPWGTFGFNAVRHRLLDAFIRMETWFDARLLGSLADKNPAIKGNALGRFDKPLLAARERVERIYRGRGDAGGLRVIREAPSRT